MDLGDVYQQFEPALDEFARAIRSQSKLCTPDGAT
jgi:hypothetical protein